MEYYSVIKRKQLDTINNSNESPECYGKWKKITKGNTLYEFIYMTFLKKQHSGSVELVSECLRMRWTVAAEETLLYA